MPRILTRSAAFIRAPSLRGHTIIARTRVIPGMRAYSAVERATQRDRQIFTVRSRVSSIVDLAERLRFYGVEFEVCRLRNGDLCCVADTGGLSSFGALPIAVKNAGGSLGIRVISLAKNRAPLATLALGVLLILVALSGQSLLASNQVLIATKSVSDSGTIASVGLAAPDVDARTPEQDCAKKLELTPEEVQAFLEDGKLSKGIKLEVLATLQNGGIRQVRIQAICETVDGRESTVPRLWLIGLSRSKHSWLVTKMTQLKN